MGFLDNLSDTFNSAASATSRGAKTVKLKSQIGEVNKRRADFAAQLGASLYDATKDYDKFRIGRENLYDGIAECDRQREQLQREVAQLEAEAAAESQSQKTYTCQQCGNTVRDTDAFCSGCGKSVSEIKAECKAAEDAEAQRRAAEVANTIICPHCGAKAKIGDTFCLTCGKKLEGNEAEAPEVIEAKAEVIDAPAPTTDAATGTDAAAAAAKPAEN